ncbi:MAG: restriction endonuclease [Alphaproteobacteria bacterium]|nr:restriction endonuclease [Alphaproteobacteria bacterium]
MSDDYQSLMRPWLDAGDDEDEAPPPEQRQGHSPAQVQAQYAAVAEAHRALTECLEKDLLGYIHAQSADFFEELILDVVLALGFAGRRRDLARKIGRSGDGGIDGIIELDELGLDAIYLQAKRFKPGAAVSAPAVRDFIGSLETRRATKGIFVTTGDFTARAREACETVSKRVVLINGKRLTELMIRHGIGTRVTESFQFKEVDVAYFQGRTSGASKSPAPIHSRK